MVAQTRSMVRKLAIQQHNAHSPLLSLPPELRLRIYDFAIFEDEYHDDQEEDSIIFFEHDWYDDEAIMTADSTATPANATIMEALQPPLSRVCSQIRAEILPVFYQRNVFYMNKPWCGRYMDVTLTLSHLLRMKKIKMKACGHPGVFFCLALGKYVEDLELTVYRESVACDGLHDRSEEREAICKRQCPNVAKAQQVVQKFKSQHREGALLTANRLKRLMWKVPRMRGVLS